MDTDAENRRLNEARELQVPWKRWGPYLSERQWGTVREDYSATGSAWDYFTHDQARSRAYRWGEDGLAGFSDDKQRLCFALALWNGVDPIIKERLFGLTNSEGNHGEDVKEYYFYLDSTPTHSYMKYLYKYPQGAYPYDDLLRTNRERSRYELEYELLDTGVFDEDRYFDVFVEYAKQTPEDILIRITVCNRGPAAATLHVLPTLWFRNTWAWAEGMPRPMLNQAGDRPGVRGVAAAHQDLGTRYWYVEGSPALLFTENETNSERLFGQPNRAPYLKDGINNFLVLGRRDAVNPAGHGTKVAAHYPLTVAAGAAATIRLRFTDVGLAGYEDPFGERFEATFQTRKREADRFYDQLTPGTVTADAAQVLRQALAGMLWSKQYYYYDLDTWLQDHGIHHLGALRGRAARNQEWFHMLNDDVISMPDKWEYPWFAAWDLAAHTVALAMVDIDFAKAQLDLMLRDLYLHPSGQIPAYEWAFGDVNPPVHAWATLWVYQVEKEARGKGDVDWLRGAFKKLLLNFTWWVNRKDPAGRNLFAGGFLGLDNIGVFDRSAPLPTGGQLEQADGTAWMALFCQNMLEIALELAIYDATYEDLALKFVQHFLWIAATMALVGEDQDEMWDEEDGFFYDVLRLPDGQAMRLRVRSMVGLLPISACAVIQPETLSRFPQLVERVRQFIARHPELSTNIAPVAREGVGGRRLLAILDEHRLRRVLARMLDEDRFLSAYGIRSLSRYHKDHPYVFTVHGEEFRVEYMPAESTSGMFGGNSNWRGPIWMPLNALLVRSLVQLYSYYGDDFTVECPTGSGTWMNLFQVSQEIATRLTRIFLRDKDGRRPVYGGAEKFQTDPHWRDYILFYEYFHGDNGAGVGASHQTGWTGLVARLIQGYGSLREESILAGGTRFAAAVPAAHAAQR
jgi:hypothetical protein